MDKVIEAMHHVTVSDLFLMCASLLAIVGFILAVVIGFVRTIRKDTNTLTVSSGKGKIGSSTNQRNNTIEIKMSVNINNLNSKNMANTLTKLANLIDGDKNENPKRKATKK